MIWFLINAVETAACIALATWVDPEHGARFWICLCAAFCLVLAGFAEGVVRGMLRMEGWRDGR